MFRHPCFISLSFLACSSLSGTAFAVAEPDHIIEPNDFFSVSSVAVSKISPSGKQVAWVESRWDQELSHTNKDIWVVDSITKAKQRLTFSAQNDGNIVWSNDEKYIYFSRKVASAGKAKKVKKLTQVFRYSFDSASVSQVTKALRGIKQFQLSADNQSIYYSTYREQKDDDLWSTMRATHNAPKYGHGKQKVNPIIKLDLNQWRATQILDDNKVVWDFSVSDDNNKLARITTLDNELIHLEGWSEIEVYDVNLAKNVVLEDDLWRAQAPSPYGWLEGLAWSDDNNALAFRIDFDGFPGEAYVAEFEQSKVKSTIKLNRLPGITLTGSDTNWRPGSRTLCYRAADRGRIPVVCTENIKNNQQGSSYKLLDENIVAYHYSFDSTGNKLAFTYNGLDHFHDIYLADISSTANKAKRLTAINPQIENWQLPSVEVVTWQAPDGSTVEGILELPYGYKKSDGPLPTIIQLHGGPTASTPYALRFRHYGQTSFAAQGWAVMSPNYRGSTGYGDKFLTDLVGKENNIEVKDILAGVDKMVKLGISDPDKLAVMGWSNGGYLTNALISKTNRFKAASSGAGNFDQKLQWLVEDTPGHVINFMQGHPWEKLQAYNDSSPMSFMKNVTTPTLIHMGENDPRVPVAHARGLYRALKQYLNVPVELIVYPGEGHGLTKYEHRKAKMDWDMKWFNYYVLGKSPEQKED